MPKKTDTKINITVAQNLRHDLKNKLTVIKGYSELLLKKTKDEKEKVWINEILKSSEELLQLINKKIR